MCDYSDYAYEHVRSYIVAKTRKRHQCHSCSHWYPPGVRMDVSVGRTEGDFGQSYCCAVCRWALDQPEHSPLHICWGWGFDGGALNDQDTWYYIRYCLEHGETPTITGLEGVLAQHSALLNS